ncbi:Uncharacterized protein TCAP_01526 [Tolypocladium capitatum]|uniref:Uncharacterized protein n=1 Tax=Tolypocladium capitatum TaxID=45235 RepID=A0A2K3QLZ3_9HYPO|nr:Uncharacterized protein TCAP_01526 [Tolypocladium capitatum]
MRTTTSRSEMDVLKTADAGRFRTPSSNGGWPSNIASTTRKTTTTATTKTSAIPSVIDFTDTFHTRDDPSSRIFVVLDGRVTLEWTFDESVVPLRLGWRARSDHNSPYESVIDSTPISGSQGHFSAPDTTFLYNVAGDRATLNLSALLPGSSSGTGSGQIARRDGPSQGSWLGQEMVMRVDWSIGETEGSSQSGVFSVVESYADRQTLISQVDGWMLDNNATDGSQTIGSGAATTTGAGPNGAPGSEATPKGGGSGDSSGGGLSAGAIAGIAVGCGVALILIVAGLVWFLLRRRRRNEQATAYAPTQKATNGPVEDEDMPMQRAADSPRSPYQAPRIGAAPVPTEHGRGGADSDDGRRTKNPRGVSRTVAHLVEEGMTADEIRHLEDEERHLDAEIERAGRHQGAAR